MNKHTKPPKLLLRFFRWFCHPDLVKYIEGDLIELFEERVRKKGVRKARWLFVWDVVKLLRPGIIRRFGHTYRLNQLEMLGNYLKTSIRSIRRNALFSGINILGLATSMSVGILMIIFLSELYSFDDFHEKKDRIYRVISTLHQDNGPKKYASSSIYIGQKLKEEVPGIEEVAILKHGLYGLFMVGENALTVDGYFVSEDFLSLFSFGLISGNASTALKEPNSVVLTQSYAKALFGTDQDVLGRTISASGDGHNMLLKVTGVVRDIPKNSHLRFKALVSLSTVLRNMDPSNFNLRRDNMWNNKVYLSLKDHSDHQDVSAALEKINLADNQNEGRHITNQLQPLTEIVPSEEMNNEMGPAFSETTVYIMILLTIIVLLSGCFNYTNLSLARTLRRSKEVAIRKVTGANRRQVLIQFMTESIVIAFISVAVAMGMYFGLRNFFLQLPSESGYDMYWLEVNYHMLPKVLLMALTIGILSGLLPSIVLSKLKAKVALKNASQIEVFSGMTIRQVLIVFQFALSIGLIVFSTVVYKQYQYSINYDLGFQTESIINIETGSDFMEAVEAELAKLPEVVSTAKSEILLGISWSYMNVVKSENQLHEVHYAYNYIDEKYLDLHGIRVLAGAGFHHAGGYDSLNPGVVVSKKLVSSLNLGTMDEAVGKHLWLDDENKSRIIGVVEDFVPSSLNDGIQPFVFLYDHKNESRFISIKINSGNLVETIDRIETAYKKAGHLKAVEIQFYDDRVQQTYEEYKVGYMVMAFLAFLAVSISALGILGMAVYTAESRMKELSIRKVLGATVEGLMFLLSRSFLIMLLIAALIATPVSLYIVKNSVLSNFVYHIDIGFIEIFSGFGIVLIISVLTIGWQIRKAAVQNPANLLRDE